MTFPTKHPLFTAANELNTQLTFAGPPTDKRLRRRDVADETLPGQPRISLDHISLLSYLNRSHLVTELDALAPRLWLAGTPESSHISPLHHQAARGRRIIAIEDPRLHLIWVQDQIFIKPVPRYFLSCGFWAYMETQPENLQRAALGFMRTYSHLIKYESDFRIATTDSLQLLPMDDGTHKLTYERYARFITPFEAIEDSTVSSRYLFGELRLTRLNMLSRLFLGKLTYHHVQGQWMSILGQYIIPILWVFAFISTILSAMQVGLTVQDPMRGKLPLQKFQVISFWFSIIILIIIAFVILTFSLLVLFIIVHDVWFAHLITKLKKQGRKTDAENLKSAVV